MNAKAERIEQIIQIISRNLALILSHEEDSMTPLNVRELQKVDMGIFSHDKFAFEMAHFVKSETIRAGHKMTALWEWNFLKGLETLLVETAVVEDDIERDCFISRIYCWYNEKLLERRDLPRGTISKIINITATPLMFLLCVTSFNLKSIQMHATTTAAVGGDHDDEDDDDNILFYVQTILTNLSISNHQQKKV